MSLYGDLALVGQMKPRVGARINEEHRLTEDLMCWLVMNEGGGTIFHDLSMQYNDGTLGQLTGEDWVSGDRGPVPDFDGTTSDGYIEVANMLENSSPFSMSGWFRNIVVDHRGQVFGGHESATNDNNVLVRLWDLDTLHLFIDDDTTGSGTYQSIGKYIRGQWNHVCLSYGNEHGLVLYLNGEDIYQGTPVVRVKDWDNIRMGAYGGLAYPAYQFEGQLDNFRVWSRALSTDEVLELFLHPFAGIAQVPLWSLAPTLAGNPWYAYAQM